jgi:mono/diheme cytochrome c family protein
LRFDNSVFPVVSVLDLASGQALPAARIDLSTGIHSVNLPFDIVFSSNGKLAFTVNFGSGDLTLVDLESGRKIGDLEAGDGPSGIALAADGRTAYVLNSLSGDLAVMDMLLLQEIKRVPLTTIPLPAAVKRGKLLFVSSRPPQISRARWMSCASCHFDGEADGRTWFFPERGPRNTTSLLGAGETPPLHWSADRDEFQDFEWTIRDLQAGSGLLAGRAPNAPLGLPNADRSADLDALAAYLDTLKAKPSPHSSDLAAIARGRALFERADVGCASCHRPPRYTDTALHDVGTAGPEERADSAFDTPSLRMLWDSAPYLHDGSAATLRDVLVTKNPQDRHGRTSQLSATEIQDLIVFLLSL